MNSGYYSLPPDSLQTTKRDANIKTNKGRQKEFVTLPLDLNSVFHILGFAKAVRLNLSG